MAPPSPLILASLMVLSDAFIAPTRKVPRSYCSCRIDGLSSIAMLSPSSIGASPETSTLLRSRMHQRLGRKPSFQRFLTGLTAISGDSIALEPSPPKDLPPEDDMFFADSQDVPDAVKVMVGDATRTIMDDVIRPLAGPVKKGVSGDVILGAALTGAASALLVGVGPMGAAFTGGLSAYVSIHPGVSGNAARTAGDVTFKTLEAATKSYEDFQVNRKLSAATRAFMAASIRYMAEDGGDIGIMQAILDADAAEEENLRAEVEKTLAAANAELARLQELEDAKAAEKEAAKLAAEKEAVKLAAEKEAAKLTAEMEALKVAAENEAKKIAAEKEEEMARLAVEEAERIAEEERIKEERAAEEARLAAEREAKERLAVEETARAAEKEANDIVLRATEEARLAAEREAKKEAERLAAEEAACVAEEEAKRIEAEEAIAAAEREEEEALLLVKELEEEEEALSASEAAQLYEEEMRQIATERMQGVAPVEKKSLPNKADVEQSTIIESPDYSSMTVVQLKEILRSRGLRVGGRKAELIERLQLSD
mmetsp:Transcript_39064/g.76163  ORF Transcript_39064/g.76163 Transcript_39064/m.76163 type:complete len:541 (+) Transcript_39064:266-1888(+)|eukprot:CAMPEP_0194318708 /NCGR_PEP_ID=MMETSP0171-20130528/15276_1 /TAXON_ID=218684 /ORGANISM="Corethron pennatum, Strain L29A3" /LENGTH=540 /DNA_ID=CAMNT_0039075695 /DNA_START=192 /DNA_END=1814 /DNA_ORIENTATION=-